MKTEELDDSNLIKLSYCLLCDASVTGGENSFLRGLGELQRQQKVDLLLESCDCEDVPANMLWRIQFSTEGDTESGK
jgi:hypothetical protein